MPKKYSKRRIGSKAKRRRHHTAVEKPPSVRNIKHSYNLDLIKSTAEEVWLNFKTKNRQP